MRRLGTVVCLAMLTACGASKRLDRPGTAPGGSLTAAVNATVGHRAESFLKAILLRDWATASNLLSAESPLAPLNDRTAAEGIIGKLQRSEIWDVEVGGPPIAMVSGCGKFGGDVRGRYKFIMTLVKNEQDWEVYHFEILHESIHGPAVRCSYRGTTA